MGILVLFYCADGLPMNAPQITWDVIGWFSSPNCRCNNGNWRSKLTVCGHEFAAEHVYLRDFRVDWIVAIELVSEKSTYSHNRLVVRLFLQNKCFYGRNVHEINEAFRRPTVWISPPTIRAFTLELENPVVYKRFET